ncbi:winged helix DNA-binding domain-containing protein [Arthrobacter citreus]|uniref:winged helix DNA-binding domain-containing protein n=1 Tax=Arthrobacter citreus TaxID=1670 RepID=UPI0036D97C72
MEPIARAELLRRRAFSHGLGTQALPGGPAAAVSRLFALQGQDLPGVLWSIGVRTGATQDQVRAAFNDATLVRTWPFRGTLHVLAAEDVHWLLSLTAERTLRSAARRRAELDLDERTVERTREVAEGALAGRRALGRKELLARFESAGISTSGQRGYHLLWHLSISGTTVLGPFDGAEQQIVLLDDWVARRRGLDGDAALAEVVRRYLRGRSPATTADLAWWTKLPVTAIRRGLAACGAELEEVEYDGAAHWQLMPPPKGADSARIQTAVLLPGFDEYLLGYTDRSAALASEHAPLTVPGKNGVFKPTLVLRGRVAGVWSRKTTRTSTEVTVLPFSPISSRDWNAVERAACDYGRFLGTPVTVERS